MFDELYGNIGGKLKAVAKGVFIIESIAAMIGAIVLVLNDIDFLIFGILIFVLGPVIAWVSSWILYAFGELIEKTTFNENNTRTIVRLLRENNNDTNAEKLLSTAVKETKTEKVEIIPKTQKTGNESLHKWRCDNCGKMISDSPCPYCGK